MGDEKEKKVRKGGTRRERILEDLLRATWDALPTFLDEENFDLAEVDYEKLHDISDSVRAALGEPPVEFEVVCELPIPDSVKAAQGRFAADMEERRKVIGALRDDLERLLKGNGEGTTLLLELPYNVARALLERLRTHIENAD